MTRCTTWLLRMVTRLFHSEKPKLNRSRLIGMYFSSANNQERDARHFRHNQERQNGKFAQNRQRV